MASLETLLNTNEIVDEYSARFQVVNKESQFIGHYQSIHSIDESQFDGLADPIIAFRSRGEENQVKVTPFNPDVQESMADKSFVEKMVYFAKKVREIKNGGIVEDKTIPANIDYVSAKEIVSFGTYIDFINSFANPQDLGYNEIEDYFYSKYLDLESEELINFSESFNKVFEEI
jgi:hypothetical protein